MNSKLILPLIALFLFGCGSANNATNRSYFNQSAVITMLDGTFIVRKTNSTPVKSNLDDAKYFQYYSGLHADSIGCKSYSEIDLSLNENQKAYKCKANGNYLTEKSVALGTPWQ